MTGRKEIITFDEREKLHKINNIAKHNFEVAHLGKFKLVYPIVDAKHKVVYDPNNEYSLKIERKSINPDVKTASEDSTSDGSKNESDTVPAELTDLEKLARKYQTFIDNVHDGWEDFNIGYRFRYKNMMLPEDQMTSQNSNDEKLNSRNPSKSKNVFHGSARNSSKTGFANPTKKMMDGGKFLSQIIITEPIMTQSKTKRSTHLLNENN